MKLKRHGAYSIHFVESYVNEEISRLEFDLDYSGYVIEHFPGFEAETPRLAAKYGRIVDAAYDNYSWMSDDAFRLAMSDALNEFFGIGRSMDIY